MARRTKLEPARILFKAKGPVSNKTDAWWHGANDTSRNIGDSSHLRVRSTAFDLPRYVAGESKAIKAEGYYSTATWTERMLDREQKRRF